MNQNTTAYWFQLLMRGTKQPLGGSRDDKQSALAAHCRCCCRLLLLLLAADDTVDDAAAAAAAYIELTPAPSYYVPFPPTLPPFPKSKALPSPTHPPPHPPTRPTLQCASI